MATAITICNDALVKLGVAASNLITALGDGTRNSDYCNQIYAEARDQELRAHNWNFAKTRAQLSEADMGTWSTTADGTHAFGDAAAADSKHAGVLFLSTAAGRVKQVRINVAAFTAAGDAVARLYTDASSSPGVQIGDDSDTETISATGEVTFEWSGDGPAVASGTSYWMVISNTDTTLNVTLDDVTDQGTNYASGKHDTITSIADQSGSFAAGDDWRFEVLLEPLSGFDYLYSLPSDFLRVIALRDSDADFGNLPYEVISNHIATDSNQAFLSYVRQETEPNNFDPLFRQVLAFRIAGELAIPVVASQPMADRMGAGYTKAVRRAKSVDAVEDYPEQIPTTSWVTSRFGGRSTDWGIRG